MIFNGYWFKIYSTFILMKKLVLLSLMFIGITSCGINKQAKQIKALGKCQYHFINAQNVTLAGTEISQIFDGNNLDLSAAPALALGYLTQNIPLRATITVEINNPSAVKAAINNFDYIIQINKQDIASGEMNQQISIEPGQKELIRIQIDANIFQLIGNQKVRDEIVDFLTAAKNGTERKGLLTLKIKPSVLVGNSLVKYPAYINIDKEVSNKVLM